MDVEKVIRVLGYIVYVALWMPFIIVYMLIAPIWWMVVTYKAGYSVRDAILHFLRLLMVGIQHDMEFIRTGKW